MCFVTLNESAFKFAGSPEGKIIRSKEQKAIGYFWGIYKTFPVIDYTARHRNFWNFHIEVGNAARISLKGLSQERFSIDMKWKGSAIRIRSIQADVLNMKLFYSNDATLTFKQWVSRW